MAAIALEPFDGSRHTEHEKGIVEVGEFRIQEDVSFACLGNAAGNEKLCEYERQTRFAGQRGGRGMVCFSQYPALGRESARQIVALLRSAGREGLARPGSGHAGYSSSSSS